ncbi:MAG: glycosyltransferase family 4 protein [Planctomycetota bacterium]|jgi:glycosyltransferase involved in cell wall biosynthesis
MRIGLLAPLAWPLPPPGYGPWEQVAYNLGEALVARGHDVTVFAAGGSEVSGRLVATSPHPLEAWPPEERARPRRFDPKTGLLEGPPDARVLENLHVATCMEQAGAGRFDVVHSHLHVHALGYGRLLPCPLVTTLHGAAWSRANHPLLEAYRDLPFVSLSDAERSFLPGLNYVATVPNGIRLEGFPCERSKEDYLLYAGRFAPEKAPDEAVAVALRAGRRILLAGMIEPQYRDYFARRIEPHLDGERVAYVGDLTQAEVARLYRKAAAVLFLARWSEPFGMVAVEAQASGTPVIATNRGGPAETVRHGETGFLVESREEAVAAVARLGEIDPGACRAHVEERFTAERMAEGYERVYRDLCTV